MTIEYRCSNCGTVLHTTNADPLHDELERLRAALKPFAEIGASRWIDLGKVAALSPDDYHAAHRALEQKAPGDAT